MASKCPQCGRPSIGVCLDCFADKYPFGLRKREIEICKCGKHFFKGEVYESLKDIIKEYLPEDLVPPPGVEVIRVKVKSIEGDKLVKIAVEVYGTYNGSRFKKDWNFKLRPVFFACEECSKIAGGYYEAIMQVRVEDLDYALDETKVAKVVKVKGGLDYYMMSREYAKLAAYEIRKKGYFVKTSSKLIGTKNGRNLYRVYYAVKGTDFGIGDVIEYDGRYLKVREIARDVKFTDIVSGKNRSIKLRDLEHVPAYARKDEFRSVLVNALKPDGMQVMDSETYEIYNVPQRDGVSQGDAVKAVLVGNRMLLV
ncbi:MAG: NMD3-related protein [Candidatus Altiarchaeota archaeon]